MRMLGRSGLDVPIVIFSLVEAVGSFVFRDSIEDRTVGLAVVPTRAVAAADLIDRVHRCGGGRRSGLGLS